MQSAHAPEPRMMRHAPAGLPAAQAGKMLLPLLGVLAALSMAVAAVAIVFQMQERDKRLAKERELHLALAENEDLKGRLDETQQAKVTIEQELSHVRRELAQSKEDLSKTLKAQAQLQRSIEDREQELARVTKNMEAAQSEAKEATAKLTDLTAQRDEAKRQLADLEKAKGQLEAKVMELSGQPAVELDKVLITREGRGGLLPTAARGIPSTGQIVVVNREYDFIVMNLGKNHGLLVGQEFQVVRGDQVLGTVKVEKVYDELSAAAILPDSQKDNIREGDTVKAL